MLLLPYREREKDPQRAEQEEQPAADVHGFLLFVAVSRSALPCGGMNLAHKRQHGHALAQMNGNLTEKESGPLPKHKTSKWDKKVGERIRALRIKNGLSQTAVADVLDRTYQMFQKIEKGASRLSAEEAMMLAKLFRIDVNELCGANESLAP